MACELGKLPMKNFKRRFFVMPQLPLFCCLAISLSHSIPPSAIQPFTVPQYRRPAVWNLAISPWRRLAISQYRSMPVSPSRNIATATSFICAERKTWPLRPHCDPRDERPPTVKQAVPDSAGPGWGPVSGSVWCVVCGILCGILCGVAKAS